VLEQARAEGELEVEVLKTQLKDAERRVEERPAQPLDALQAIEEKIEMVEETEVQEPIIIKR